MLPVNLPIPPATHSYVFSHLRQGFYSLNILVKTFRQQSPVVGLGTERDLVAKDACRFPVEDCSSVLPEQIRHSFLSLKNKGGSSEPKGHKSRCALIADKIISNLAQTGNRTHQVESAKISFLEEHYRFGMAFSSDTKVENKVKIKKYFIYFFTIPFTFALCFA